MRSNISHSSSSPRDAFGNVDQMVEKAYGSQEPSDEFAYRLQQIEERLGDVATKMVDDRGRIDLRKLTGEEAMRYMGALGISIPRLG